MHLAPCCHSGRFISPPDRPVSSLEVWGPTPERRSPTVLCRLAASMRRRIEESWEEMDPGRRDRLCYSYGAALAVIGGVSAGRLGRQARSGIKGVKAILDEIHIPA